MTEPIPEQPAQELPATSRGRVPWLVDPAEGRMLLPACGLWILGLDWLLFSSNAVSLGLATPVIAVIGFVFGSAGTFFFQRRFGRDSFWGAAIKAFLAGLVVGVPWPLAGTILGGGILVVSGLGKARSRKPK